MSTIPEDFDLSSDVLLLLDLVELDTTAGPVRLLMGEDARFIDVNGNEWLGSKLLSTSEIEFSINGTAPAVQLVFSYVQDPDADDLIKGIKDLGGVETVRGREAKFYVQYLSQYGEFWRPVFQPDLLTTRVMYNLEYNFEGPQIRTLLLTVEGPFNLRSKPTGGRYTTADHSRLVGYDNPSLEFMPNNSSDPQKLFGL